jgi:hypothetical protein
LCPFEEQCVIMCVHGVCMCVCLCLGEAGIVACW